MNPCTALPPKRRGELAESVFVTECLRRGFAVARPFGDSERFDFLVVAGLRTSRVQVKSAWRRSRVPGQFTFYTRNTTFSAADFDFIAFFIAPDNLWYIIPAALVSGRRCSRVKVSSSRRTPKSAPFREAWHLLSQDAPMARW